MAAFLITLILFALIISIVGGFVGGLAFGYVLGKNFEKHVKEIYLAGGVSDDNKVQMRKEVINNSSIKPQIIKK